MKTYKHTCRTMPFNFNGHILNSTLIPFDLGMYSMACPVKPSVAHPASVQGCIEGVVAIHPDLPQLFSESLWFGVKSGRRGFQRWREATIVTGCGPVQDAFRVSSCRRHQTFCLWSHHAGEDRVSGIGARFCLFCLLLWRERHRWVSI